MNTLNKSLAGLLVVQAGLVALTWTQCQNAPDIADARPVVDIKAENVTALEVTAKPNKEGEEPETVRLEKTDDGWIAKSAAGYPADTEKVKKVIDTVLELRIREPMATSEVNHDALRVSDDEYSRKVAVEAGDKKTAFYLGSGSGSSLHVRFAGENDVYQGRGASVYAVSSGLQSYIDTKLVEVDKDKLTSVAVKNEKGTLTFTKDGDAWKLEELPAGKELDETKLKSFLGKVARLSLSDVVGKEVTPEHGFDSGVKVVLVSTEDAAPKTTTYFIGAKLANEDKYYARVEGKDYVTLATKWATSDVREKSVDDFIVKPKEEGAEDDAAARPSAPPSLPPGMNIPGMPGQ